MVFRSEIMVSSEVRSCRVSAHHGPGEATLTPVILVRIQVPQPYNQVILPHFVSFRLRRNSSVQHGSSDRYRICQ